MIYTVPTYYEEMILEVTVATRKPQKIRIKVLDADQPNTCFTDRYKTVNGSAKFFIRMPVTGNTVLLYVYNEANGEMKEDSSFTVPTISKQPLEKKLDVIDFSNPYIRSFIEFCTRFCYNAGSLPAGTYASDDNRFVIEYAETIQDGGEEQTTPARIDINSGRIEVSRRQFLNFTVPNRMAILLHEFSHVYMNDNVDDEIEADLNGLLIYLGLGYPRIEAFEVFAKTFINAPSEDNRIRYDKIKKFIDEFEGYGTYLME